MKMYSLTYLTDREMHFLMTALEELEQSYMREYERTKETLPRSAQQSLEFSVAARVLCQVITASYEMQKRQQQ